MTLVASPTPSLISIASSSSASSVGDQSPRQFALSPFSDVSASLTPNQAYRSGHAARNNQSHSQPTSPAPSGLISSLPTNPSRVQSYQHQLEDANRLGGKSNPRNSSRSLSASFGATNAAKKEKKKLNTRRLIDREKHSANECRRRTEMREKFTQLQEITHCVYKDRQNILITAIRRIAEQNARLARLEKEKLNASRDPKSSADSSMPVDSATVIPASATVVTALSCKAEEKQSTEKNAKVVASIPVNTLASIGATELLPSFLLAHPDTIVDVNAAFFTLFHLNGTETILSTTLSSLCCTTDDTVKLKTSMEHILSNEPHHMSLQLRLSLGGREFDVQLILRAILSPSTPPQIYGVVSAQKSLPTADILPSSNSVAEAPVLPAVIIKEEPGVKSTAATADHGNHTFTGTAIPSSLGSLAHSASMSSLLDTKMPSYWEMDSRQFGADPLMNSEMDVINEPFYVGDIGAERDPMLPNFEPSTYPLNLAHSFPLYDHFNASSTQSSCTLSNGPRRSSISSAFVDTTIWNEIM